jgi:disulfide bond formation protein DsbB
MEVTNIALIIGVVFLAIFLLIARKLLRLAFRLVVAGFIVIALLLAISFGWWQGWFNRQPAGKTPSRPSPTRRVSSN